MPGADNMSMGDQDSRSEKISQVQSAKVSLQSSKNKLRVKTSEGLRIKTVANPKSDLTSITPSMRDMPLTATQSLTGGNAKISLEQASFVGATPKHSRKRKSRYTISRPRDQHHSKVMDQLENIKNIKDNLVSHGHFNYDVAKLSQINFDQVCSIKNEEKNVSFKISKSFSQLMQLNQRRLQSAKPGSQMISVVSGFSGLGGNRKISDVSRISKKIHLGKIT